MEFANRYASALKASVLNGFTPTLVQGMTSGEIEQVAQEQDADLPESYRQFLLFCGKSQGGVLSAQDVFFSDLPGIKSGAEEAVSDGGDSFSLDGYVVFMMHQGYIFYCMQGGGSDPEVFGYSSVESGGLRSQEMAFSEFMERVLSEGL